jgi:CheY-like chemotaxis protein
MPDGGSIEVIAENVIAGESLPLTPGNYIRIAIRDQGPGVPPEILPNIFDPYFTTKSGGSGLGLATSHSIISKHGGHITVDSREGVGATFCIYLPASEQPLDRTQAGPGRVHYGSGRILVMDDEIAIRKLFRAMLGRLGYEAECAADGREALTLYRKAKGNGKEFAAVILDLTIPGGMGGRQTATELREIDPHVRLIVCSGYSAETMISEYRAYGFDDVLLKPWTIADLSAALLRVLR